MLRARWLGRVPYGEADRLQRALHERAADDYLLLLEHPHVYTLGTTADPAHVLVQPATVGAELVHVDRGGDVTYHGPGQLVGYPIVTLPEWRDGLRDVVAYVRLLEDVLVGALAGFGIEAHREPRYTGVWVGDEKIAAIGVKVARGRTRHGFALNVDPDLTMTLPASVTLQSGLDALSHALESIWNVNANPVSDALAVSAARAMMATLPALMQDLGDAGLRARASQAALQAGLAFSNTKTALAHSLSYEMTLRYGLPHGIACSFTLPLVLERARGRDAARDATLAQVFDCPLADAGDRLRAFLESLGVSPRFEAYGVDASESTRMIADALEGPRGRNFIGA